MAKARLVSGSKSSSKDKVRDELIGDEVARNGANQLRKVLDGMEGSKDSSKKNTVEAANPTSQPQVRPKGENPSKGIKTPSNDVPKDKDIEDINLDTQLSDEEFESIGVDPDWIFDTKLPKFDEKYANSGVTSLQIYNRTHKALKTITDEGNIHLKDYVNNILYDYLKKNAARDFKYAKKLGKKTGGGLSDFM